MKYVNQIIILQICVCAHACEVVFMLLFTHLYASYLYGCLYYALEYIGTHNRFKPLQDY
jgi:hypothetical protein